jgi:hypothetical protein
VFQPAAEVLKKSNAVPVEIIGGCQRVKPLKKAKQAVGINTSDEESSDHNSDDIANMGSKCKVSQNKDNSTSKKK